MIPIFHPLPSPEEYVQQQGNQNPQNTVLYATNMGKDKKQLSMP
jgi:hypothetical protein